MASLGHGIVVATPSVGAVVALVLSLLLLCISGFVSASEIAFFSLSPSDLNDVEVNLERLDLVHHCERLELLHIKDCMKIKSITIKNGTLPNCQELKIISRISRLA